MDAELEPVAAGAPPALRTALPGPAATALVERLAQTECPALTTRRARRAEQAGAPHDPIVWARAAGCHVWDTDGNRFVDFSAGFGAAAVGHGHPEVRAAIAHQSQKLLHALGDLQPSDIKIALLERLAQLAPFDNARVMLGLHGGDAVEAALKTALLYSGRPGVLAFTGGYHGLSHGPLALCGYSSGFRVPFAAQLNPHVVFARYPTRAISQAGALDMVARTWDRAQTKVGAVVIEPMLGRGGVQAPPAGFLSGLQALCRDRGALLVLDEVMTGLGRTGHWLRGASDGAPGDLICLGKALGGGLPVSACLGREEVMAAWGEPDGEALHTATFLGNPLGCAAALAALSVLEREALPERAARVGAAFRDDLQRRCAGLPGVREVRGEGLLLGIAFERAGAGLLAMRALLERGYISVPAGPDADVLSLTPPLTMAEGQLAGFADALVDALEHGLPTPGNGEGQA